MLVKNKYVKHTHVSKAKLSRQTINKYLTAIRLRILGLPLLQSDPLVGQIEVDESYFDARPRKTRPWRQRQDGR